MAILNEGIRKAAMWAPIQFKRDRPKEDLRLPSVIIFKDNVCEMKIGVFNLKDIFNIISWNLKADNHAKGVWLLAFLAKK